MSLPTKKKGAYFIVFEFGNLFINLGSTFVEKDLEECTLKLNDDKGTLDIRSFYIYGKYEPESIKKNGEKKNKKKTGLTDSQRLKAAIGNAVIIFFVITLILLIIMIIIWCIIEFRLIKRPEDEVEIYQVGDGSIQEEYILLSD